MPANTKALREFTFTPLSQQENDQFQEDVANGFFPGVSVAEATHPNAPIDYRGYWKDLKAGKPEALASINQKTGAFSFLPRYHSPFNDGSFTGQNDNPFTLQNLGNTVIQSIIARQNPRLGTALLALDTLKNLNKPMT